MSSAQERILTFVTSRSRRVWRGPAMFVATLFGVVFLDELIYGVQGAALPLIRNDLNLTYVELGLLLTIPGYVALVLDPFIGLLGDTARRKALIVGGALATAAEHVLVAAGRSFGVLLGAFSLGHPASTAYVSLSQATLMDLHPGRHEQVMARWAVLGSLGDLVGPLLVGGALVLGLGWRSVYWLLAGLALVAALALGRWRFERPPHAPVPHASLREALRAVPRLLRATDVLRWLVLMQLADLLLDVLFSFTALYFTDVVGASPELAAGAVTVLTAGGLLGDVLLIPLLERVDGVRLMRVTAALALVLYAAFLLAPGLWLKLALLALLGPVRSGWWQVLEGRAYSALPGSSGTVVALSSLVGLVAPAYPVIIGAIAERAGLPAAMAVLALGPLALLAGLPRRPRGDATVA